MVDDNTKTEFNSNTATLERVDQALKDCSLASRQGILPAWYSALQVAKREAWPKMKDDERDECKKTFSNLSNKVQLLQTSSASTKNVRHKLENDLDECELWLREIMDSRGMLLRDADDARTALQRG